MSAHPIYDATVRAWCADEVDRLFAPLRAEVGLLNPLAYDGPYCACGTYLRTGSVADAECPMCGGAA